MPASAGLLYQGDTDVDSEDLPDLGVGGMLKRKPTPLPKVQLSLLLYMEMAESVTNDVVLPFMVQLVMETGITGGDVTKLGYYTGLVDSFLYLAEAFTIFQWARLSDRIGRRPVLFTGLFGLALSILSLGLSHAFWAVVASRALTGLLNGNKAVIKSALGELSDSTNMAQAFAIELLTAAMGSAIAPLIGGMLQHPYERLGGIFHNEFWRLNPYFLPCLVAALSSLVAFSLGFSLLKETAPCRIHRTSPFSSSFAELTPLIASAPKPSSPPPVSTLLTPHVLLTILTYGLLGLTDTSFYILQPLVLSTPIKHGGLGLPPSTIGTIIAAFSWTRGLATVLFFAPLTRRFGEKRLARVCVAAYVICYALFPIMNRLARVEGRVTWIVWVALSFQLAFGALLDMALACLFLYVNASTPTPSVLGAINGLAQTTASIMRILGPASVSSLFALSVGRNLLGGGLVYVVMCILATVTFWITGKLPESLWEERAHCLRVCA